MAYDEHLADRIRQVLKEKNIPAVEKKMMGGLTFMVDEKMCVGIVKSDLMARVGPHKMDEALSRDGCRPMDFTGRPMKGYVFISPDGVDMDDDLNYFIELALIFNKEAKSSKKKK